MPRGGADDPLLGRDELLEERDNRSLKSQLCARRWLILALVLSCGTGAGVTLLVQKLACDVAHCGGTLTEDMRSDAGTVNVDQGRTLGIIAGAAPRPRLWARFDVGGQLFLADRHASDGSRRISARPRRRHQV